MDDDDKKRVLIEAHRGEYWLLAGEANMNVQVYVGSLENCQRIKAAYLATGEYIDQSPPHYRGNA